MEQKKQHFEEKYKSKHKPYLGYVYIYEEEVVKEQKRKLFGEKRIPVPKPKMALRKNEIPVLEGAFVWVVHGSSVQEGLESSSSPQVVNLRQLQSDGPGL